jgi:hypothetical protein
MESTCASDPYSCVGYAAEEAATRSQSRYVGALQQVLPRRGSESDILQVLTRDDDDLQIESLSRRRRRGSSWTSGLVLQVGELVGRKRVMLVVVGAGRGQEAMAWGSCALDFALAVGRWVICLRSDNRCSARALPGALSP